MPAAETAPWTLCTGSRYASVARRWPSAPGCSDQRATRPKAPSERQYSLVISAPLSRPIDENFGAPFVSHVKSPSLSGPAAFTHAPTCGIT